MKNFEESVKVFRRASLKLGALLCLMAVVIFTMPVGAQRDLTRDGRSKKASSLTDSVQTSPTADPVIYTYSPELDSLFRFNATTPEAVTEIPLVGIDIELQEILEFIDFRPLDGLLYAVAVHPITGSRVVTINTTTGQVTTVGSGIPTISNPFYGGDFNPVVDLIREVGFSGSNRRLEPTAGTVAGIDTNLAYASGDPNFGKEHNIVHAAYSNNFVGATSTTLYGIDTLNDVLVTIGSPGGSPVSPNTGQLFTVGPLTVDGLGIDVGSFGGFDIAPGTGIAYAVLNYFGFPAIFTIDLATGAATLIGPMGVDPADARMDGLSVAFTAGAATADLSITKTDGFDTYAPGIVARYTVVASNAGPDPVVGATVTDIFSSNFEDDATFTCVGTGGGTCPASGSGNINALVNLPVGATVTFSITVSVTMNPTGPLENTATITPPASVTDPNPGNSSATDVNTMTTSSGELLVSGRVMAPDGRGLRGARVTIVDSEGVATSVLTSSLGYYTFEDVTAGGTYVIGVASRQYRFTSRVIQVSDDLTNVDFIGLE